MEKMRLFAFADEADKMLAGQIRAMQENGIEYLERNVYGAGQVKRTGIPERVRFFVRYRDHAQAAELNEAFFSGSFDFEME